MSIVNTGKSICDPEFSLRTIYESIFYAILKLVNETSLNKGYGWWVYFEQRSEVYESRELRSWPAATYHNRVVKSLIAYKDTYVPRINFHVTTRKVDACRELASIYSRFRDTRSTINIGLPPPTCALGRQFYFKLHVQFEDRCSLAPVL